MRENYASDKACEQLAPQGCQNQAKAFGAMVGGECARQSAKGVLRDRVQLLRREADRLEALARAMPEVLPPEADQALWDLLISVRR